MITGVNVSGFVYLDGDQNSAKEGTEAGTGLDLFVKIFNGAVTNVINVDASTGGFTFTNTPPGTYTVLVSTNNSLTDLTPTMPTGWTGTQNSALLLTDVAISLGGTLPNLSFGLYTSPGASLFVQKTASKTEAEIADVVGYTVLIKNIAKTSISGVTVTDRLPAGFVYVKNSARLDHVPIAEPAGSPGPTLVFSIGNLAPDQTVTNTYRVIIGPGALQGTGKNYAQAAGRLLNQPVASNVAMAKVKVVAGVFDDKPILIGKVFVDTNHNQIQDEGELGIPGVRLYIEDGTWVITDSEGKYSLYGLRAIPHVVKVDETTLPVGWKFSQLTPRHNRRGTMYTADLKRHEIRKVNFADISDDPQVLEEVKRRRAQGEPNAAELQRGLISEFGATGTTVAGGQQPAAGTVETMPSTDFGVMVSAGTLNNANSNLPKRPVAAVTQPILSGRIEVVVPAADPQADGQTPVKIGVNLLDAQGSPIRERTLVTLEASRGRWQVNDENPVEPGVQTFVEGGAAEFGLLPPMEAGRCAIVVTSGAVEQDAAVTFVPPLRPLIAAGMVDARVQFHKLNLSELQPARNDDGFEEELRNWTFTGDDGKMEGGVRGAVFLKGKIKGDYLLTLAYDSDKGGDPELFRDIQPDKFYPVYGDSSIRGFDAQSTSKLYVRVDKRRSYVLYGDYTTATATPARSLGNYSRSLNGGKWHYENRRVVANAWAAHDSTRQRIEELPGDGTSGPYFFNFTGSTINSEKVEILVRDRYQPAVILRTTPLMRFVDYEFEPFAGRILFRAPVPSLDENFNPISIRVTFELDSGGDKFWVAGGDAQLKITDWWEVGGSTVLDDDPIKRYRLHSLNSTLRLTTNTFLIGEVARSDGDETGVGDAGRLELRHQSGNTSLRMFAAHTETNFYNTAASVGAGRQELGANLTQKLSPADALSLQAIQTRDVGTGGTAWGVVGGYEHMFPNLLRWFIGARHSEQNATPSSSTSVGASPNEVTTLLTRITTPVPGMSRANLFGQYENDISETGQRAATVGADYQVDQKTKVYARHEFLDAFGSPFELNNNQENNRTVFGVQTEYMKDGQWFNEYRMRDATSGREAESAIGLRNGWQVADGLRLSTTFERVHPILSHTNSPGLTAAYTIGAEYTANPLWRGSSRVEYRHGDAEDHWLNTIGFARKLSTDWTLLTRSIINAADRKNGAGDLFQSRLQLGVAWRETETDVWNALFKYEYKFEDDAQLAPNDLQRHVHTFTTHVNYHPFAKLTLSGRYAFKVVTEADSTFDGTYDAHLLAGRVMYDFAKRWSAGLNASTMFTTHEGGMQYAIGPEIGYRVHDNIWLGAGYNVTGFRDQDLTGGSYTDQGFWFGMRLQFDEHLLDFAKPDSKP